MDITSHAPPHVTRLRVEAVTVPTDQAESDGTLQWDSTTIVLVHARAAGTVGVGYTYGPAATGRLIVDKLGQHVIGGDALSPQQAWHALVRAGRNAGRPGLVSMAIAAVDIALWDLKARLLKLPLAQLLGPVRAATPIYGSGGFTSYDDATLCAQLGGWVADGIQMVKMKVGREPADDPRRVRVARDAIGDQAALFVDGNGAYGRKQALALAERFREEADVSWFEEPVSSDDLAGLRLLVERGPAGMDIAAGEYGYHGVYFRRMLAANAVDVLQADVTRCSGITGYQQVHGLCQAFAAPLSAHTAPAVHCHLGAAMPEMRHIEYFHDHVRIESLVFDGAPRPVDGRLAPDRTRHGLGLEVRRADLSKWRHEQIGEVGE